MFGAASAAAAASAGACGGGGGGGGGGLLRLPAGREAEEALAWLLVAGPLGHPSPPPRALLSLPIKLLPQCLKGEDSSLPEEGREGLPSREGREEIVINLRGNWGFWPCVKHYEDGLRTLRRWA